MEYGLRKEEGAFGWTITMGDLVEFGMGRQFFRIRTRTQKLYGTIGLAYGNSAEIPGKMCP